MTKAFLLIAIACFSFTASAYDFSDAFDELRTEERRIEFLLDEDRFENIGGFHQETYMLKENYDNCESDGSWPLNRSYMFRIENDNFHNGIQGRGRLDENDQPIIRGEMNRPISLISGDLKDQINLRMSIEIDQSEIHQEKVWMGETTLAGLGHHVGSKTNVTYVESPITNFENNLYLKKKDKLEKDDKVPFSWKIHATWVTSSKYSRDQVGQRYFTHIELDSFGNLNELSITELNLEHKRTKEQFETWKDLALYNDLISKGKKFFYYLAVRLKCGPNPRYTKLKKQMRITEEQMKKFHVRLPEGIRGGE